MSNDLLDLVAFRRFAVLVAALACFGVGPASAQTTTTVQAVEEELLSLTGTQPALAADVRGGFVAIWTDTEAENEGLGIRGCLLAPRTGGCGPHFAVNTTAVGDQIRPAVAADDPGRFVVVWQGAVEAGTGVFGQRFGAGGVKLGSELVLSPSNPGSQQSPRVAMEDGGSFVAVWLDHHERDAQSSFALARFSSKGEPLDAELQMKAEHGVDEGTLVASYRGGFAVGRNEASACAGGGNDSASVSRFDSKGGPVGKVYELAGRCGDGSDSGFTLASLVGSRAGALAVLAGPEGYSAQRFAPSGEPSGDRFALTRQPACVDNRCERAAAVAMDDGGHFAVIWEVSENGTSNLFAQLFAPGGKAKTERLAVNASPSQGSESPAAALADDDSVMVAWSRSDTLHPEKTGLFLRRMRLQ
jgi:hypothetical protein